MIVSTLFNVDPHIQVDTNISTPEVLFFNVLSVNALREENQTTAGIKSDDEGGWFMLWGCLSIGAVLSALAMAEHTYRHCHNSHRQHDSVNAQAGPNLEYCLTEETKEEFVNPSGGAGNPFQGHHPA